MPGYRKAIRDVAAAVDAWAEFAAEADVDEESTAAVAEDIRRIRPT